jgi:hypothetical protein
MLGINDSTDKGSIYKLNPLTGVATAVGPQEDTLAGFAWDMEFDPVTGELRLLGSELTNTPTNRRVNPDTGIPTGDDADPAFVAGDPNAGAHAVAAGAYTNSVPGATERTYFALASFASARMGSINGSPDSAGTGKLGTIAPFEQASESNPAEALDISGATGQAFALPRIQETSPSQKRQHFAPIDLATGAYQDRGRSPAEFPVDVAIAPTSLIDLNTTAASADEGGRAAFNVVRRGPGTGPVTVGYQAQAGTATTPADFTSITGTLSFASGETAKRIEVPVASDSLDEKPEQFSFHLTSATGGPTGGAVLTDPNLATVTIADAPPSVGKLGMTNRVFAPARARASAVRKRRAKRGTTFKYRLSENDRVTIAIDRRTRGRKVGKRCRRATGKLRNRRRCARFVRRGKITVRSGKAGANKTRFSGRFKRRALPRGRYRATLVATDSQGQKSKPRRIAFRVVRG